tara:strand:+ start:344 stop:577 length:234 start_codon:yes stop_codon:yes gene_type:complete
MLEIIIAIIVGILYYKMMDASVPTESNCSFLANPLTDFLAFLWGAIVIYYGKLYKNKVLVFLGATVIVEHICQFQRK